MSDLYFKNGLKFEGLSKGNAFETYLSQLKTTAFPLAMGKHTHGKTLIMYGDSLTQYHGGDGRVGEGFLTQVNKYLGMEITQSGYAGSTWTGTNAGDCSTKINSLLTEGKTYNVIILAWGTNSDTTKGNGTINDEPSETGTMVSVMKWAISQIRTNFPNSGIGIIIPPPSLSFTEEKANLMIECCKHSTMHVPYLDLFHSANITTVINTGGVATDQIHLSSYGINRYASALGQFIEKICPYI